MMMPPMPNRMPQSMPADPAAALPQAGMAGDAMNMGSPMTPGLVDSIKSKLSPSGVGFKKPLNPVVKKAISGIKKAKHKMKKGKK